MTALVPQLTIEPFVGFRTWRVVPGNRAGAEPDEPVLMSLWARTIWHGPFHIAECQPNLVRRESATRVGHGSPPPHPDCSCGVYATKERDRPRGRLFWGMAPIRLTGTVLEGARGFRATKGQIVDDVELWFDQQPGMASCTFAFCDRAATHVIVRISAYQGRCADHAIEEPRASMAPLLLSDFVFAADRSFTDRYGVGARLGG